MPKILIKRGTATQWSASTTALLPGELGLDTTNNILKVGNGTALWGALSGISFTNELAQDAIGLALNHSDHSNILVTYNDAANKIVLSSGPNLVTFADLGNSLGDYIPLSYYGNEDGVATLDSNGFIPDAQIPSTIARDSELFSGSYNDLTNKPGLFSGSYNDLSNKPSLFSGIYDDLLSKPTLFSGSYNDLTNKPTIPSLNGYATETYVGTAISNLVDSAPSTLNTLNELAAALGDDANYATTISTALGNKLDSSTASSTYLTQTNASSTYLTQTNASSTYLTQTNASSTYAPIASPTFTGTVGGITKSMVGLGNVDNTSDANKPVSTAVQTELDLKLSLTDPSIDYYITNSGSGAYLINGSSNGTLSIVKGKKYRIHINASGHPFWIQTVSGAYSSGNVYSSGITNNGAQFGHILVELPQNAPDTLYYACQYHSMMSGSISVSSGTHHATIKDIDNDNLNVYITDSGTSRTLGSGDKYKVIEMTSSSPATITLPNDPSNTTFPIGVWVEVRQMGTGQVTVSATSPATVVATDNQFKTRVQYSSIVLEKRASNAWYLAGDTTA